MEFKDKVVLVTGASSGMGAATAIAFAEKGANVAIVGRNLEKLKNVAETCKKWGGKALIIKADVTKDADVKRIIYETIGNFLKLNVLVNSAGTGASSDILDRNAVVVFDKLMALNLRGTVHITHLAAPHLIKTKGNIVNVSSVSAFSVLAKDYFAYGTSKAALNHFSQCIALDLAPKGVRVNIVNPGPVKTDILSNVGLSQIEMNAVFESMKRGTALSRIAEPEEIADLIVFIASDKGRSITGSSITSDNGLQLIGKLEVL